MDFNEIIALEGEARETALKTYAIEQAKAAGYKAPEEVNGLVKKRDELLGDIKKYKEMAKDPKAEKGRSIFELLESAQIITEDDDIESIKEKLKTAAPASKFNEAQIQLKRSEKLLKELEEREKAALEKYTTEKNRRVSTEIERKISAALDEIGVIDSGKDIMIRYFKDFADASEDETGNLKISAKDSEGLSPDLSEYITAWSKTDKAKPFLKAPVNSGAGISGGGKGGRTMSIEEIAALNISASEKVKLFEQAGLKRR